LALVALIALPTFAQSLDTGLGSMSAIGLGGGGDIRILIAKIIRVLLGFLAVVAVGVVLYGGYLWMTAAGNEERIRTARSVLINGLIGLVIILSAYAIVYFFITRLLVATDDTSCTVGETRACVVNGCTGVRNCVDPDGDGKFNFGNCIVGEICVDPGAPFSVRIFSPKNENNDVDRNTVVRVYFNKTFKTDTVTTDTIKLFDITNENSPVEVLGTVTTIGSSIAEFRPSTLCPSPRESDFCFSSNTPHLIKTINGAGGIIAIDGVEQLTCSPTPPYYCESKFTTNDRLDIKTPQVSILKPGNSAPVDSDVNFKALATDNGGVSQMSFYVDNNLLETMPNTGADGKKLEASTNWLTTGLPLFSKYNLKVDALDLDSNTGSKNKDVTIVAQHCFNDVRDKDETGIDCGGSECLACGGEICSVASIPACSPNACASGVCNGNDPLTCTCAFEPIITDVRPNDGAVGNFITIFGNYFGNSPGSNGKINFLGDILDSTDDAVGVLPSICSAAATWKDNQIIVEVPTGAVDGPIEVIVDSGLSDRTDLLPGALITNFDVNDKVRPGLCEVLPDAACYNDPDPAKQTITFKGKNFGAAAAGELFFGDAKVSTTVWTPQQIQSIVPNIVPAIVGARVKVAAEYSNPLQFQVLSCTPKPRIDSIAPNEGPRKQTLTITGANFGSGVGEVYFVLGATEVKGSMDFPIECGPAAYWKDKQVIVKVPDNIGADDLYNVYIKRQDGEKSNNDKTFKLDSNLPLTPSLFCLKPDNGPEGISVDFIGDKFGSSEGVVKFYNDVVAIIDDWKNLKIKTKVPVGAVTGPTKAISAVDAGGQSSNPLNFSVGSCLNNQNICAMGQVCCGDGSCRANDDPACLPPATPDSSYRWRLTTGNPAPRVVEERACTVNALYNGDFEGGTTADGLIDWWGTSPDVYPATDFLRDVGGNHFYEQADCDSVVCPYGDKSILAQYVVVPRSIGGESFTLSFSARHNTANSPLRAKIVDVNDTNRKIGDFAFSTPGPVRLTTSWQRYTGSILVPANETVDKFYLVFDVDKGAQIDNVLLETAIQITQSPSPWKGSTDACTNAQFSVRFSTKLKDGGIDDNDNLLDVAVLELQSCGNDSSCKTPGAKVLPISPPALFTYMDAEGNELSGFTANLGSLQPNTWYQATVTSAVLSDKNVPMRTPYVWRFKTRAIPCAIAGLSCQPAKYTLKGLGSTIGLAAGLTAVNCNILNCGTGDVNWSSSADGIATVDTAWTSCNNIATAVGESPPVANISTASIKDPTARPGLCKLTVVFNEFNVEEVYPACETACINAAIGAVFSVSLKTSTANSTTVKLEKCTEQTCVTSPTEVKNLTFQPIPFTRPDGEIITDGELQISLPTGELLDINTYYQVTLVGGANGLKSIEGKELKNTNGIIDGVPVYRWIFKTTDKQCEAKKLVVTPSSTTVQTIGAKQSYFSQPYSAPDSCSSKGQRLNASSFGYDWSSNKVAVATVTNDNIMPPTVDDPSTPENEARIDPLQKATAVGTDVSCNKAEGSYKCKADIESVINSTTIADSGEFILQCGYSKSGRCAFYCNSNKKCLGDNTRSCVTNDDCRPLCNTTSGKCRNSGNACSVNADCTTVKAGLCTNENKSCNTDVDCTTDASSNKLNLCGGGNPVGGCTKDIDGDGVGDHCGNDTAVECLDANSQPDNRFCNFSTNNNSCCGARPWVETITGSVSPVDWSICRNTAFVVTFNSLMDRYSVENNIFLEWLAPDNTCNYQAAIDKYNEEHIVSIQQNWWKKIWSFVTKITNNIIAQGTDTWCRVPNTTVFAGTVADEKGVPIKTKAILSVSQLLYDFGSPDYRVVVVGEDASNIQVGSKNIYGIKIDKNPDGTDYSKDFEIGDHVCKVERVDVEVAPLLPLDVEAVDPQSLTKPHDLFSCFGNNCSCSISTGSRGCRLTVIGQQPEDQVPSAPGNQHRYFATAKDALGQSLSSNYKWFDTELPNIELDPQDLIELNVDTCDTAASPAICKYSGGNCSTDADCVRPPEQFLMTKGSKNGFASMRVRAELGNDPNTIGQQTVPITVFLCKNRWDGLKDGPSDTDTNFYTTYCRDTGKFDENKIEIPLPYFITNPIAITANNNPLNILKEWILKDENSVDAIGVRVVGNERHLTPAEWYNEQPITKGSPQSLMVDGFPAIRDGRTIYIGAGNAVNNGSKDVLYTNIYIFSHNQGAEATTINIFNQLISNVIFSINQLSGGSCTNKVDGDFATKSCAISNDCAEGFVCNSNKKCENKTDGALARESCLFDNDCAKGFICNNTKSAIARDVKRLNDAMEMTVYLADYRYGTGCKAVTPGAPGDANCNGIINGSDIILATYYKTNDMPSYCLGADYDGSTIVDDTDVGLIKNIVQTYCKRSPSITTNYPSLSAGTYITGSSTSRWPSWVSTLGNDLGHQLPVDPLNYFAQCEAGGTENAPGTAMLKHDPNTCWDEVSKTYASHYATLDVAKEKITKVEPPPDVPDGNPQSRVYTYSSYGRCTDSTEFDQKACIVDSQCSPSNLCVGQGQDYAVCTFFERSYTPEPAVLGQNTGGNRVCLITSGDVIGALPSPPAGTIPAGGIIPPESNTYELIVNITGSGAGSVVTTGSVQADSRIINKPAQATVSVTYYIPKNEPITMVATALSPANIGQWGGSVCSGVGAGSTCEFTLNSNKIVNLSFINEVSLIVKNIANKGGATVNINGYNCTVGPGSPCGRPFDRDTANVSVTVTPDSFSDFVGWQNCTDFGIEGGNTCSGITMDTNKELRVELTAKIPVINSFVVAGAGSLVSDQDFTVTWATTNAASVSINSNEGSINASGLSPSGSKIFRAKNGMNKLTLTAIGPGGTDSQNLAVTVNDATVIASFWAVPNSIMLGESVTLNWNISGTAPTSLVLEIGSNTLTQTAKAGAGSTTYTPTTINDNTYILIADGPGGQTQQSVTININNPTPTVIDSFTSSASTVEVNKLVTLNWNISGTAPTSLVLEIDASTIPQTAKLGAGSTTHTPTTVGTKTYKLISDGPGGHVEATVTVNVVNPPSITSFTVDKAEIATGEQVVFGWTTQNATSITITGNPNVSTAGKNVNSDTASITLTTNTTEVRTYTLTATNIVGTTVPRTVTVKIHEAVAVDLQPNGTVWIDPGASTTITWATTPATEFKGISSFTAVGYSNTASGSVSVSPSSDTTYTIVVKGYGSLTATDQVTVKVRPTVALTKQGSGTGKIDFTSGVAYPLSGSCTTAQATCEFYPQPGDTVTLTAVADAGSRFTGWTNCPSGSTSPCMFTVSGFQNVVANFVPAYNLTVSKLDSLGRTISGQVAVTDVNPSSGGNLVTSTDGQPGFTSAYTVGTTVTLTASDTETVKFSNWILPGNACDDSPSPICVVTLSSDISITANFVALPAAGTFSVNRCQTTSTACVTGSANSRVTFSWNGWKGADSVTINPGNPTGHTFTNVSPECIGVSPETKCSKGSWTVQMLGSTVFTLTGTNTAGSTVSNPLDVWITGWSTQSIADINLTDSFSDSSSSRTVFSSPINGYLFFTGRNNTCQYVRGTRAANDLSGAFTWSATPSDVSANCRHIVAWYDQWTPAPFNTGSFIHVATTRVNAGAGNNNRIHYSTLNVINNTLTSYNGTGNTIAPLDGQNLLSVAKSIDNKAYFTVSNITGSLTDQCTLSTNSCVRLTNPYPDTDNEGPQFVPLTTGDSAQLLLYHYNPTSKKLQAKEWTGSAWGAEEPIDINAIMTGYAGNGFSALTNPTTGESVVAYRNDGGTIDGNDTMSFKWRPKGGTFQTMAGGSFQTTANGFIGVSIALDSRTGYIYVAYAEQSGGWGTATIKYRRSVKSMNDSTWRTAGWTSPITVISTPGDYHGLTLNYLSGDIIYVSAANTSAEVKRIYGSVVNVLTPP